MKKSANYRKEIKKNRRGGGGVGEQKEREEEVRGERLEVTAYGLAEESQYRAV